MSLCKIYLVMKRKNILFAGVLTLLFALNVMVCFANGDEPIGEIGSGTVGMACTSGCQDLEEGMDYCHLCHGCYGRLGAVGIGERGTCR